TPCPISASMPAAWSAPNACAMLAARFSSESTMVSRETNGLCFKVCACNEPMRPVPTIPTCISSSSIAQGTASSPRDRNTLPARMQPLHPQARAVLEAIAAARPAEPTTIDEMRRRQVVESQFFGAPEAVRAVRDIHVEGRAGPIGVRLYAPDVTGPRPMVMFIHGG